MKKKVRIRRVFRELNDPDRLLVRDDRPRWLPTQGGFALAPADVERGASRLPEFRPGVKR